MAYDHPFARVRSDNEPSTFRYRKKDHTVVDPIFGTTRSIDHQEYIYYSRSRYMEDISAPDYEERRKSGSIVMNPMNSRRTIVHPVGACRGSYKVKESRKYPTRTRVHTIRNGVVIPPFTLDHPDVDEQGLIEQSLTGAHGKAAGNIAQLLVTFAEFRKTLDLIIGVKKRFAQRVVDLLTIPAARSKRRGFERALNLSGSTWLEARYGWRPFLHDVDNIWQALNANVSFQRVYRDQYVVQDVDRQTWENPYAVTVDPYKVYWNLRSTQTTKVKTVVLYRINQAFLNELNSRYGLTSILSTAWELIPFSFVVDWFLTIGDWLAHMENSNMIQVVGSCTSVNRAKYSVTVKRKSELLNKGSNAYDYSHYFAPNFMRQVEYERFTNLPLPAFPGLNFKPLTTGHKLDAFFLANAVKPRTLSYRSWRKT